MAYTTTTLLDAIAKIAAVPVAQTTFENQDILDIASQCIETEILPKVLMSRQDFYVVAETFTPSIYGTDIYPSFRIPSRAVGQSVIGAYDVNTDDRIDPMYYWVEGSRVYFDTGSPASVRVRYYIRPGKLVQTTDVATITDIDTTTGVLTVSSVPTTISAGVVCDLVRSRAGFDTLAADKTVSLADSTSVTFDPNDLPSDLAVGDYIALADQSPVPQIPIEWIPFLGYWTAHAMLETLGDMEAAAQLLKRIPRMETNALSLISPRIVNKSKAITRPRNYYWRL
jgi:hypothetical protein